AAGRQIKTITSVDEGKYGKPVLTFDDGTKFSVNGTNVAVIIKSFGPDDSGWIGQRIELRAGTLRYNGEDNAAVLVRALVSAPEDMAAVKAQRPARDGSTDDDIPF